MKKYLTGQASPGYLDNLSIFSGYDTVTGRTLQCDQFYPNLLSPFCLRIILQLLIGISSQFPMRTHIIIQQRQMYIVHSWLINQLFKKFENSSTKKITEEALCTPVLKSVPPRIILQRILKNIQVIQFKTLSTIL